MNERKLFMFIPPAMPFKANIDTVKIGELEVSRFSITGIMPARDSRPGNLKVLVFLTSGQTVTVPVKEYPKDLNTIINQNVKERENNESVRDSEF